MTTNMQAKPSKATMSKNTTSSEPALCRFYFQNQQCRYGSSCRFSHEAPKEGMTRVEILSMIPCPYYARGVCSYGDDCELLHQQQQNHEGGPTKFSLYNRKHKSKKKVEEEEEVIDTTCGICLENVYNTQHKQFGLLSCCNHIFCHTCLMEWRCRSSEISSSSRRVCPTCREPSNYVIPSHTFPTNPSQKLDIVQNYKQKCSTIPCRKFVNGKLGSCPFGRDCFYAHQDESGVDVKDRDKTMQELFEERERHRNRNRRNNRDSDLDMIAETLMMMALQRQFLRGERRPRRGQAIDDDDDDGDDASFGIDDMYFNSFQWVTQVTKMVYPCQCINFSRPWVPLTVMKTIHSMMVVMMTILCHRWRIWMTILCHRWRIWMTILCHRWRIWMTILCHRWRI
ncbi:makorin-related protein, partial [Skeletonema marinoi]